MDKDLESLISESDRTSKPSSPIPEKVLEFTIPNGFQASA